MFNFSMSDIDGMDAIRNYDVGVRKDVDVSDEDDLKEIGNIDE